MMKSLTLSCEICKYLFPPNQNSSIDYHEYMDNLDAFQKDLEIITKLRFSKSESHSPNLLLSNTIKSKDIL